MWLLIAISLKATYVSERVLDSRANLIVSIGAPDNSRSACALDADVVAVAAASATKDVAHLVVNRFDGGREVAVESIVGADLSIPTGTMRSADLPFLRSHWRAARTPRRAVV
jgi:hypothetical protein